ncbi:glycosyltransferase family 4 protein [Lutibacter aestuarii]|uniref:Glycosyltransferase family 4 protein n=1 Tax=Lutibacter aestuarii TaxID=861111 RepID=A0ABW2Z7H7_9FLAO
MMTSKTVFISHLPIPNPKIASWTNRYTKLIKENTRSFDYIIAPKGKEKIKSVDYCTITEPNLFTYKIVRIIPFYKHKVYWNSLKKIIIKHNKVTVHIIDNPNILFAINYYSKKNGLDNQIRIIFHMCGYSYKFDKFKKNIFYNAIDTLVVQTNSSLKLQNKQLDNVVCNVKQVYNGIDGTKFFRISKDQKQILRNKYGVQPEKMIFLWVSQDRPKKGLSIILDAWNKLIEKYLNIELFVIGCTKKGNYKNVRWLGKVKNYKLPEYYQLADFYLFSTQCHEGFGLTLGEALKCGVSCIASNITPMDEILNSELYGKLVNNPSDSKSWEDAIHKEIIKYKTNNYQNIYLKNIPENIYDYSDWSKEILNI